MLTRLTVVLSILVLAGSPVQAAEFTFVTGEADNRPEHAPYHIKCNIRMEGQISAGDADKFEALLAAHADDFAVPEKVSIATLCLNSPGGSLSEGIKLAEAIRKDRPYPRDGGIPLVVTRLEAGAVCESACAIAFMAGTLDVWEQEPIPQRSMHPTARLGFHAPALDVGDGKYNKSHVTKAFQLSVNAISEIQRVMNVGADPDGKVYRGTEFWMKGTLIEAMLKTPATDMRHIETVDDAGRWGIQVYPVRQVDLTYKTGYRACINRDLWRTGASSKGAYALHREETADHFIGSDQIMTRGRVMSFTLDYMSGSHCEIWYGVGDWMTLIPNVSESSATDGTSIRYNDVGEAHKMAIGADAMWLYPSETPLAALLQEQNTHTTTEKPVLPSEAVEWAPRFGGAKVSYWTHNGSGMAWESKGNQRWIWYFKPRAELTNSGVAPGTLLFEGRMANGVLAGTARRFSAYCDAQTYDVSGQPKGTHVELTGQYRQRDEACASGDWKSDRLVFDYVAKDPKS